ncbi:alpha/beta hydrolase [Chryseobacterium potabilaquae]|uniref:Carboxylesterase NlhH n=1 Tax=Chryseobacterium potabilaquae TaxID=2675057 RepID=A0A6N4X8T2_9FLAO|nr:alpha/beta hydrolase [Chryseobacterium potabilaquae]CAA7196088.1 Carboxylesterase NlhH [Chryseobacterium potabilaquae]
MQFKSEVQKIIDHLHKMEVFDSQDILDRSRKGYETMAFQLSGKKESIAIMEEINIPQNTHSIPCIIYRPSNEKKKKTSAIIYLHGGWFVSGSIETHDAVIRKLANATGSVVIFIDYRLAPEYPFPAGLEDINAASEWIINNSTALGIDENNIGVAGDSAGGALAISLATQLRTQLKFQILIYPAADNTLSTPSWETYKNGPVTNKEEAYRVWNWYLSSSEDKENPLAIPILIKDFKDVPPALVILAEHDPLLDEGVHLINNMKEGGVMVETLLYKDMVHGFMHMGGVLKEVQESVEKMASFAHKHFI